MRALIGLAMPVALATVVWGCGGGSSSSGSSPAPSAPSPTPSPAPTQNTVTISIVGSDGSGAFVPNPATVPSGSTVIFKNNDTTTHNIVMNDGSADLGNLAPGGSTTARALNNGNFHCTIHPSMVGSINGSTVPTPSPSPGPAPYSSGRR